MTEPIERPGVRVVVLDDEDRVLLVRSEEEGRTIWVMPGGAVEPGETDDEAAVRELREEVGLANVPLQPLEWRREHTWTWSITGETYASTERYFLARVHAHSIALEASGLLAPILEARWWTADELEQAARARDVEIVPRRLAEHVRSLLVDGPPNGVVDVGI